MFNKIEKTFHYGEHEVKFETGAMARQADGAVVVSVGDTVVLVTVVGKKEGGENNSFFPLSVHYQEKAYSAGRIPGGFFKREGRPTEKETLTSRLIDRPLRPLFPEGFMNEVQVIATVISMDPQLDSDIPAMLGASAALAISGIPFAGPIGGARVGYVNEQLVLNPTVDQLAESNLDLIVAGTKDAILMVESEANELSEQVMLQALDFGHKQMQAAIQAIEELAKEVNTPAWEWQPKAINQEVYDSVSGMAKEKIASAYQVAEKQERYLQLDAITTEVKESLCQNSEDEDLAKQVSEYLSSLKKDVVRSRVLNGERRIDGRDTRTVRPIDVKTSVLPRTHGSAIFTRGETQALVVATLGTGQDAQMIDELSGGAKDQFMLHYNFPPYSVGEAGFMGGPKRREIGHGRLAKRAIKAMIPTQEEFPYVLRVVSEITESNGSSSMATVCGTSLALMDAGVPMKAPVAGIAMGLILDNNKYAVLSDILGDEDHLGDMDFKVAGTSNGVTALQMDIKIDGITMDIMAEALEQAKEGRLHILDIMNKGLSAPRTDLSEHAPRITTMKIHPDKIRDVIGKGGATIKSIIEDTGVSIDIDDDGTVNIAATEGSAADAAIKRIEDIIVEPEIGVIYDGKVMKITDFGAFVNILPGRDGLLHISQISQERVEKVEDVLNEGQEVRVKVLDIDRQGKIKLSMKALAE